ncbi:MAG: histidinol dehydrogenase [Rikenellaceae bacterium]
MNTLTIYNNPQRCEWDSLLKRNIPQDSEIASSVAEILSAVRSGGDKALREVVERIEGVCLQSFEISAEECQRASESLSEELKEAICVAKGNIEKFHSLQRFVGVDVEVMPGVRCMQKSVPIRRVGLYVPGGSAPLFSTVLMLAIPAKLAGCKEIVLCSPARNGAIGIGV